MYKAYSELDLDVLQAVAETARESPRRMRTEAGKVSRGPTALRIIRRLSKEPGAPVKGAKGKKGQAVTRWKSKKQRIAFFASKGFGRGIPYVRKHRLAQGWQVLLETLAEGEGVFIIKNDAPEADKVQGDNAQPFHLDTGWPQATPIIRDESPALQDELINGWYRVVGV